MNINNIPDPIKSSPLVDLKERSSGSASSLIIKRNRLLREIEHSLQTTNLNQNQFPKEAYEIFKKTETISTLIPALTASMTFRELEKINLHRQLLRIGLKNRIKNISDSYLLRHSVIVEIGQIESVLKKILGHPSLSSAQINSASYNLELHQINNSKTVVFKINSALRAIRNRKFEVSPGQFPRKNMLLPVSGSILKLSGDPFPKGNVSWAGIIIESLPGEPVKAVGSGEIVFASDFNTLKNLVILDHENDYLTLYGNLDNLSVSVGMSVDGGQKIGTTPHDQTSGVYFEIRKNGEPIDPKIWFNY